MIRKYRIDFRWASGRLISPYCTEGVIVKAYTAEDALVQVKFEIDEITRRYREIIGWPGDWMITKIVPVSEPTEERKEGSDERSAIPVES